MEGNIMRRKIILYLYKHHALHWILWLFHRTVGCNQFIRMKGSNIVDSSTAYNGPPIFTKMRLLSSMEQTIV